VARSDGGRPAPRGGDLLEPPSWCGLPQLFEPSLPWPVATAFLPYPRRGTLVPSFATETTFPRLELVNEIGFLEGCLFETNSGALERT